MNATIYVRTDKHKKYLIVSIFWLSSVLCAKWVTPKNTNIDLLWIFHSSLEYILPPVSATPHVQAPPGRIRGILEWAVISLINAPARIRTRDLWLWYHIELHAPTNSTQKLKLIGKGGQFTYTPTTITMDHNQLI
jgi:hypothetical protein